MFNAIRLEEIVVDLVRVQGENMIKEIGIETKCFHPTKIIKSLRQMQLNLCVFCVLLGMLLAY